MGLILLVAGGGAWGWLQWGGGSVPDVWALLTSGSEAAPAPPPVDPEPAQGDVPASTDPSPMEPVGNPVFSGIVGESVPLTVVVPPPLDSTATVRFRVTEGEGTLTQEVVAPDATGVARADAIEVGIP